MKNYFVICAKLSIFIADPYAILRVGAKRVETPIIKNTINPGLKSIFFILCLAGLRSLKSHLNFDGQFFIFLVLF